MPIRHGEEVKGGGSQRRNPAALLPGERPDTQCWEWWMGLGNLAPTGFGPRALQLLASCYADHATRPL
jgi:hypothetical protein